MKDLKMLISGREKEVIIKEHGVVFWDYIKEEIGGENFNLWEDFIKMFVENIDFKGTTLDLGCGFGIESMLLSPHCKRVFGVDIDNKKIAVFKKILKQVEIANVQPMVANAECLPFEKESFDTVFCNESLSHVDNIGEVLVEVRRVLRKGGKIIVSETKRWSPYGLWMIYVRRDFEEKYFNTWAMKRLLEESGFRDIKRVKYITAPRDPFRGYRKILWLFLRFIDPKYVFVGLK